MTLEAKPGSAVEHTRHGRRRLFSVLVLGVFLSGCAGLRGKEVEPMGPAVAEFTFEQYEVVTGSARRQTVLTGFLFGGPFVELAVVNLDENGDRRLRIYAFGDGTWVRRLDAMLGPDVLFVDVANIGGRDRLITYQPGRLNWFDPESASEQELVGVASNCIVPRRGEVPHLDVTRDVNGDGRDDLVVPDVDGFRVFIQLSTPMIDRMGEGTFADPVTLGPSFERDRIYDADGYRFNPWGQSRIHETDYNQDGRSDLVFWNEDRLEVHTQDERGLFASVAESFTIDVAFDSDDLASLAVPRRDRRRSSDYVVAGDMTGRVLHALTDMNGDGVADLVVFSLEGGSGRFFGQRGELGGMRSTYEVHFGTPRPDGGTVFPPYAGTAIKSDGIPFGMEQHDFDQDGQVDMMYTIINIGFFKVIGLLIDSLLTGSASPLDLEFYRMEGGLYPDKRTAKRKIRVVSPGKSGKRASILPSVMIGDVNGDSRSDLLVQELRKALHVFLGVPGPDLFARKPQRVAVAMPNEEYTWLADLNKDGKQDILMHHPSTTRPHRVTMLIAR